MAVNGGYERYMACRMNDRYEPWEILKDMLSNIGFSINLKMSLYEGVIVPMALYGAEAWA